MFTETGPTLKTVCEKPVAASGRCALKVNLNGTLKPFEFLVFPQCSHQMILGWDFFRATDAVIDCGKVELQLAEILPDNITSGKSDFSLFAEADYLIEANSAKQICTLNPDIEDVDEALIIGDKVLMCERELSIPASIINVESGRCKLWITNFSRQNQLIPKGINIACLTTIEDDAICSLKGEDREDSKEHKTRSKITREKLKGVLDAELTSFEKEELLHLLEEFGDIFDINKKSRKSRCNAPATFERMMDTVLRGLKWNICLRNLDDIIVYAPNFQEHKLRLRKVLKCIQEAGLTLNSNKCSFGKKKLTILGHLVDEHGIYPDPQKTAAVTKFPVSENVSDVRSFLGLCSYYRRFIKKFADIAKLLHDLLKKMQSFHRERRKRNVS
ncbi:Retrovirus-related Pol polyprotein from transposon 17.6 [Araneus ventricosus]|uniref:Retrovirus-related Pol polyprotein from transposon 17.6 n=1 Tax=Araneus ventricosus TaxID=182803 RepID=A0A4Y2MHX9_ARAVE|nr:Retrovirus-related Pol polyprotein from transposon 17.6 [Araneus ventricosus]